MKRPGMRAGWWAALGLLWAMGACAGSNPRDQYYGKEQGKDFVPPVSSAGGATGTGGGGAGGTAPAANGGTAGSGAGGDAGAAGAAGGSAGNGGGAGTAGQAGGSNGTAGQAGAGGNGGATALGQALPEGVKLAGPTRGSPTSRKDWTAAPRATKMHLNQVSSTWPWRWTTVIDTRGGGPSGPRPQPMES